MPAALCGRCVRPMPDSCTLCPGCTDETWAALRQVRDLAAELLLTVTRQDRIGEEQEGRRSAEQPLPWKEPAAEAAWVLQSVLAAWARVLAQAGGSPPPARAAAPELARWLLRYRETFRRHPDAAACADEIQDCVRLAQRSIDRPQVQVYRGPCLDCRADLYCTPTAAMIVCRDCGRCYDAAARRAWLVQQLEAGAATATEAARGVSALLGLPVSPNRIHQWASRGRLTPAGRDRQGRPLYRLRDVINLATNRTDTMSPAS